MLTTRNIKFVHFVAGKGRQDKVKEVAIVEEGGLFNQGALLECALWWTKLYCFSGRISEFMIIAQDLQGCFTWAAWMILSGFRKID